MHLLTGRYPPGLSVRAILLAGLTAFSRPFAAQANFNHHQLSEAASELRLYFRNLVRYLEGIINYPLPIWDDSASEHPKLCF